MNTPLTLHETIDERHVTSGSLSRGAVRPGGGELFLMSNGRAFGGAEQSLRTILPFLADAMPVRIFVENETHHRDLVRLGHPNVTIVRLPMGSSPFAIAVGVVTLFRHFLRAWPRALLANSHKGALLLALLRPWVAWSRARFAVYVRDFDHYFFPLILPLLGPARYFAPTSAVFEHPDYVRWGLTKRCYEVIPNAVQLPEASPAAGAGDYIGCCARLVPWKGVEYLIQAFAKIACDFPQAKVRIHGEVYDEAYVAGLRRLVDELALGSRVEFEPFEPDAEKLFGQGMFFVIPSVSTPPGPETFGRIVIESWSWRKPVISFDVGGPRHLIEDGSDGFLVEERNVDQLAARMAELLRDPERRRAMGERGYAKVRSEYQPKVTAARLLERLFA
jgi:glycosyltransferase involved in cell wall biosynthesis